ncbi:FAD-binding and (Fe-S)-binding domain-containing protein [Aliiglaciecola sp. 2_MG-2023]|uniref:D-2-hydroxyglutarate dehydrogenase YdiJ n=1 Tax=unclassified Aliiglaciecola TaxID=2593648 RepID=UPI0026E3E131|nr:MULTISPECIES: FAD-binding and (Fe-S)-binding domain-containing protein [unclassified Aliiglaciecola]MDO6711814.1 FAD-binding and (Fe-S)-binding domain-containing protein [Aliiglaciecola sp. 2_MG-2023]MDO6753012.1 FAD-binding and (Fe-S)-binding domain-containing protein [Aliiglaciecola sp. 1_MG-2023]
MLPSIDPQSALENHYQMYLEDLKSSGFTGDIEYSYASRLAVATDNSIYQKLPQAVVFPKTTADLTLIGKTSNQYDGVKFSARGGGTGTNGQSLTSGIIVDVSRHMNQILEINAQQSWVRVQAGVVKDQLNDALRPLGFFFAPDLSTSNRATIGGMISTDASGQGSLVYGKTSDHVLGLTSVLVDGTVLETAPTAIENVKNDPAQPSRLTSITSQLIATCVDKRQQILAKFPRMNRFLTGYDLEHTVSDDLAQLDISRVITGSEGSLVFVAEAKLNITPIAKCKALVNIKYDSFESALRHAPHMVAANATSVETVDSKVLNLAKQDIVWHSVKDLIQDVPGKEVLGLNMVEYNSEDKAEIEAKIAQLSETLDNAQKHGLDGIIGYQLTYDVADINRIYAMRKKSVGLLGKADGWKKPIPFTEDTAVPPENLADFIMEFRALLDSKGLAYGMFGHVDAGVLHVRPALDMCDPNQQQIMQEISDEVVALVSKYGGLMWGEHGKGYRSEYGPEFFGEELFLELRKIKSVFDPLNKMNPGKICTPIDSTEELVKVSDLKRGDLDSQIPIAVRDSFEVAMSCNGNALCYNYDTKSTMCPSSKITRDRRHTPKGRAGMIREWLRLLSQNNVNVIELEKGEETPSWFERLQNTRYKSKNTDFSHEVLEVMEGCLACKACASQCPVNVDVPSFRSRFLAMYYQRYLRPAKDVLTANIESMAPWMAKAPAMINFFQRQPLLKEAIKRYIGYVDAPLLSEPSLDKRLEKNQIMPFDLQALSALDEEQKLKTVLIVQDPFTSYYEAEVVEELIQLLQKLHFNPVILPFKPNGKPQHVKGFLAKFAKTAQNTADFLNQVSELNLPMIGIDGSLVLCYRDEYRRILGNQRGNFQVQLVNEWLGSQSLERELLERMQVRNPDGLEFKLISHCTEKTSIAGNDEQWRTIFSWFGLELTSIATGCCGMAGSFGHELIHQQESKGIYDLSWKQAVDSVPQQTLLATGYSCRTQVNRYEGFKPKHPVQALLAVLQK